MLIIFLSNQLFDFPLKTNKWHVATRVAKRGHDVLFVDPPIRFRKFVKQVFQGRWSLRRILTLTYQPQDNLTVYTPVGFLKVKNLPPTTNHQLPTILWIYHVEMPNLEDYIDSIPHDLLIYDCVDNYPAFPRYRGDPKLKEWIVKREEWLAKKADLVFTSAPGLYDRLSKVNGNTFYVGNAGDYVRFAQVQSSKFKVQNSLINIPKPIVGFTGAIDDYKVNLPLLVKIAKAYPDYSLVLIGPKGVADTEPNLSVLKSLPNAHLLGPKPYETMPQYFAQFDAYTIPYNLNDYTLGGCFPVKFFDALAAGLPTVVTNLPCYQEFKDVCYVAKDDADFVKLIKIALEEDSSEKVRERQKVAKENSWEKKVDRMLKVVESL